MAKRFSQEVWIVLQENNGEWSVYRNPNDLADNKQFPSAHTAIARGLAVANDNNFAVVQIQLVEGKYLLLLTPFES